MSSIPAENGILHPESTAARCKYCNVSGFDKAIDLFGHVHCRYCHNRSSSDDGPPPVGSTWRIICSHKWHEVTAIKDRTPPAPWVMPKTLFITPCRMITVNVGNGDKAASFVIHEPLLTTSSAYFQRALQATFKEGTDSRVDLKDEEPETFGQINRYLYTGHINLPDPEGESKSTTSVLMTLSNIWLLAHYLQMPTLLNYCVHRLLLSFDNGEEFPGTEFEEIYERAPMDSKLSKLLLDVCVWGPEDFKPSPNPPERMGWDLFETQKVRGRGERDPLLEIKAYYCGEEVVQLEAKTEAEDRHRCE